jgi:ferredoxin
MESTPYRLPQNVPGALYVDSNCIFCNLCIETSPSVFTMIGNMEWAVVQRQPDNPELEAEALEALEACPMGSIHWPAH